MWDVFKDWIFDIIHFFYDFCGDWGLAIIIVTVIFRILISPLMHKQTKSSFQMQKVQPLMQELQRCFKCSARWVRAHRAPPTSSTTWFPAWL